MTCPDLPYCLERKETALPWCRYPFTACILKDQKKQSEEKPYRYPTEV